MKPIMITVTGTEACVTEKPVLTSGMVGLPVEFTFDEAWEGLTKTAVFKAGSRSYPIICQQNIAAVPWEVLEKPNVTLVIGVFGTDITGNLRIPTVWAQVDTIRQGTQIPDAIPTESTPNVYEQIFAVANEAVQVAKSVRADADSGRFNGEKGDTPVRGVDYWTDADQTQIKDYVDDATEVKIDEKLKNSVLEVQPTVENEDIATHSSPEILNVIASSCSAYFLDERVNSAGFVCFDKLPFKEFMIAGNKYYAVFTATLLEFGPDDGPVLTTVVVDQDKKIIRVQGKLCSEEQLGDIETALDSIIAIQNGLIGGVAE